jgi:hypothetical protein
LVVALRAFRAADLPIGRRAPFPSQASGPVALAPVSGLVASVWEVPRHCQGLVVRAAVDGPVSPRGPSIDPLSAEFPPPSHFRSPASVAAAVVRAAVVWVA